MISLVTNAAPGDDRRLHHMIPSWLRTVGDHVSELLIVVDEQPPAGRIARLHGGAGSLEALHEEIARLEASDPRIRHEILPDPDHLEDIARRWFKWGRPMRCQDGTPILAFVYAILRGSEDLVMRADCDMVFCERGWMDASLELLRRGEADLVEPCRRDCAERTASARMSTRVLLLDRTRFEQNVLPITPHRLDPARRLHRFLKRRPGWLGLEQMLEREKRDGRLRHVVLELELGFSLHMVRRSDALLPGFEAIVRSVERGELPAPQQNDWDFLPDVWREASPQTQAASPP